MDDSIICSSKYSPPPPSQVQYAYLSNNEFYAQLLVRVECYLMLTQICSSSITIAGFQIIIGNSDRHIIWVKTFTAMSKGWSGLLVCVMVWAIVWAMGGRYYQKYFCRTFI